MSLLHRLMILVVAALIPAVVIEVDNVRRLAQWEEEQIHQNALALATMVDAEQGRVIEGIRQVLLTVGETAAVRSGDSGVCQALMDNLRRELPGHLEIHVTDPAGVIRCATDVNAVGISIADRAHYRTATQTGRFAVGDFIRRRTNGLPALPFGRPYRDAGGDMAGAVTGLLDVSWLESYLRERPLPRGASLTITDRNGTLLVRLPEVAGAIGEALPDRLKPLLLTREPQALEMVALDGVPRIFGIVPATSGATGLYTLVGLDAVEAIRPINDGMWRHIAVNTVVLLATLLAVWWGGHRLLRRPVADLVAVTERWRTGDLTARSGVGKGGSEIDALGRAFDAMAEDLARQTAEREQTNARAHHMASVLASMTDAILEIDRDWQITFMNERARTLLAEGRDLVGMHIWEAFPEAVGTVFWDNAHTVLNERVAVEFEAHYPPHGRWYAVRGFPSRNGLTAYFLDVSERRRGEDALAAAHRDRSGLLAQLNALLVNAPVGFAFFDHTHRYLRINDTLAEMNGLSVEEHIGRRLEDVVPPSVRDVGAVIDRIFETGESVRGVDVVGESIRDDGVPRQWLAGFYPVRDGSGAVSAVGAVVMEVTALRHAESELARERALLRAVVERMPSGLSVAEAPSGRLLMHNEEAVRLLGHPLRRSDDVTGYAGYGAEHPDGTPYRAEEYPIARAVLHGDTVVQEEMLYRRGDGNLTTFEVNAAPVRDAQGRIILAISTFYDIAGRKALEAELRAARDTAERANLAKTRFLAAASHDLRQPMQSLFFFAEALRAHLADGQGRDALQNLETGLEAMKGLLDSLLDVSRLDAGLVRPNREDFPVRDLLDHLDAAYCPAAAAQGLEWHVEACTAVARSDRTLLGRMLRNLIENALRYTRSGRISVVCTVDDARDRLRIAVQDTGIGIPEEHLERIFEEFHQVGNPERDRSQGLGLGLAIVRRLAALLDHTVEVRSLPDGGSEFVIGVPRGRAVAVIPPPELPGGHDGSGRFAALVDDDAIVLMGLEAILREWGWDVVSAGSTDELLARLAQRSRAPDVVIADYRLRAGRVGTEAVVGVRERFGQGVPGMILTGETGPDCHRDADRHGLRVVHKPVTPRQLAKAMDHHLRAAD